jgi:hypothetical protein
MLSGWEINSWELRHMPIIIVVLAVFCLNSLTPLTPYSKKKEITYSYHRRPESPVR